MQTKIIKQIIFGLLSFGASYFLWKSLSQITMHGGYAHALSWIWFVIGLAASEGFLFLLALGRMSWVVWVVSVLNAALLLLVFGHGAAALIAAVCFALAAGFIGNFSSAIENSASEAHHHAAYRLSWPFALVLLGFGSFLSTSLITPAKVATVVSTYGFPYISSSIAPFNSDQTVDAYLSAQIENGGIDHPSAALLQQGEQAMSEQIGEPVRGDEKLSDIGKQFVASKVQTALTTAGFASGSWYYLFVLLLIILPVLRLIIAIGSDLLIGIGESTGVIHKGERQITVKTLDI